MVTQYTLRGEAGGLGQYKEFDSKSEAEGAKTRLEDAFLPENCNLTIDEEEVPEENI